MAPYFKPTPFQQPGTNMLPAEPAAPVSSPRVPSIPKVQGFNPSSSLSPSNTLNELAAQMDPRMVAIREKNQLRHMNPLQQAQYTDRAVLQNEASLGDRAGANRVSLSNNVGPTIDQQFVNNRPYLAPESKAVISGAKKQFNTEIANLLAGSNKSRWATMKDYEDAVNALPSVQKYGGLIEDHIMQVARTLASPQMKAAFAAEDQNTQSFIKWAKNRGAPFSDAELAHQYETNPALRNEFDNDPNAIKYDSTPDGKIVQRQVTPGQQQAMQEQQLAKQRDEQNAAVDKFVQDNPGFRVVPSEHDARQKTWQEIPKSPTAEVDMKLAMDKYTRDKSREMGLPVPGDKGNVFDQPRTPTDMATSYVLSGMPVPIVNGKPVLPSSDDWINHVTAFTTDANGKEIPLTGTDLKMALDNGSAQFKEKPGRQYFQPTTGTTGTQSTQQPAPQVPGQLIPKPGTVESGFVYTGGPVGQKSSWQPAAPELVQQTQKLNEASKTNPQVKKIREAVEPYYAEYSLASPEDRRKYGVLGIAYRTAKRNARDDLLTEAEFAKRIFGVGYDAARAYVKRDILPLAAFLFGESGK